MLALLAAAGWIMHAKIHGVSMRNPSVDQFVYKVAHRETAISLYIHTKILKIS